MTGPTRGAAYLDAGDALGEDRERCKGGSMQHRRNVTQALGLLDVETEAYVEEDDPMIIKVDWGSEERTIYYQYGPVFLLKEGSRAKVMAVYDDGRPAAVMAPFGKGKIALCGPHPEADETWLDDDPEPIDSETWEPTFDLAVDMLEELLSD
jgi:hypothetical protein